MVEFISSWAQQLIVAVIIATIIEMIVPDGNNKKYIKVVIGIYILFTIISPVIQKISGKSINMDIDYDKYFNNTQTYEAMSNSISSINEQNIEDIYVQSLKEDIKSKLKEKGYNATNIEVEVSLDDTRNYGNINKISMVIKQEAENSMNNTISINAVNKVEIGNTNKTTDKTSKLEQSEIKKIKEYLSSVYNVKEKYIIIN